MEAVFSLCLAYTKNVKKKVGVSYDQFNGTITKFEDLNSS